MKIQITQGMINKSNHLIYTCNKLRSENCPITLGVLKAFGLMDGVWTAVDIISFQDGKDKKMPKKAIIFMNKYDQGKKVKPFSFNLKI